MPVNPVANVTPPPAPAPAATAPGAGPAAGGIRIIDTARSYLGIPYKWGGTNPMMHAPRAGDVVKVAPLRSAPPDAIRRVA
jgi:hypothetical protein